MNFKALGWIERNYKWLVALLILCITALAFHYYFTLTDKGDTFIAATLFAFCLFLAGIYLNYMNSKINDKMDERIEIYQNLFRVVECLENNENEFDFDAIRVRIIGFRVFTGREEGMDETRVPIYIKKKGVSFNPEELEVEIKFDDLYSELKTKLGRIIADYIRENNIQFKSYSVNIYNFSNFNPTTWCKENLNDYSRSQVQNCV